MEVVIRVDASYEIGSGHVMRCLTLAEALRNRSVNVSFICRELAGHLIEVIQRKSFRVHSLKLTRGCPQFSRTSGSLSHASWLGVDQERDAEETLRVLSTKQKISWVVVDHYGIDHIWHSRVRRSETKIFVLDDLADRKHDCDLLLDQSYFGTDLHRYHKLTSENCKNLIGPRYTLLRPEFDHKLRINHAGAGPLRRIFINYGGVDKFCMTTKTLEILFPCLPDHIAIDVVVGAKNKDLQHLRQICRASNVNLHINTTGSAKLMMNADLAIGCGGVVALERAFWGLPSIAISTALNQEETLRDMAAKGLVTLIKSLTELPKLVASAIHQPLKKIDLAVDNGTEIVVNHMLTNACGTSRHVDRITS